MMFHLYITIFAAQLIPLKTEHHKKRRVQSNMSDPEPSKRTTLVLIYLEKNFENKQKQLLRGALIVEEFCKLFFLIYILENFLSKFLKNAHEEIHFSKKVAGLLATLLFTKNELLHRYFSKILTKNFRTHT